MPDGVVQWFDPASGEGCILHAGRRYEMTATGSEPSARVAGARVHFDIDPAHRRAVDVVLRPGKRTSPTQRRFGDLSGAASPDANGTAPTVHPQPELGHDLQRHPKRVVERWAALLAEGDVDEAMLLYAPGAALHAEGDVQVGPAIKRHLEASPLLGGAPPASIAGEGDLFVVRWPAHGDDAPTESHLRIAHGTIVDQWIGWTWAVVAAEPGAPDIEISTRGGLGPAARSYAVDRIGKVLATIDAPVLHVSLRFDRAKDPARARPALARATVDIDGHVVRAHVAASTFEESVDLLEARLRRRLEQRAQHLRALRRRGPASAPGEWRHGDLPSDRSHREPSSAEERQLVRHKTFSPTRSTIDEAIFDLESFDDDFFLFTDLATGEDAVVSRAEGGAYLVQHRTPRDETAGVCAAAIEPDPRPVPTLSVAAAQELLDQTEAHWIFFTDEASDRGHVLYRRLDGHHGLITPADEPGPSEPGETSEPGDGSLILGQRP